MPNEYTPLAADEIKLLKFALTEYEIIIRACLDEGTKSSVIFKTELEERKRLTMRIQTKLINAIA